MTKKNLVILGGKGLGTSVALVAETELQYRILGFINDEIPEGEFILKKNRYRVLGSQQCLDQYLQDDSNLFVNCYVGMSLSRSLFYERMEALNLPEEKIVSIISSRSVIDPTATISKGAVVEPHCYVGPQAKLGKCARIRTGTYLGHDSELGEYATVAMGTTIGGESNIGRAAYIGMGVTLRESTSVGPFAKVGMGSVVVKSVPANTVCFGNPAHSNTNPCP